MTEKEYYEKLDLFNNRIDSTLKSICKSQGWDVSGEVLCEIQKVIMLLTQRDNLWRTRSRKALSKALELTREKFPEWDPKSDE